MATILENGRFVPVKALNQHFYHTATAMGKG